MIRLYSTLLKKHPCLVQSVQAGCLVGSGDIISQLVIERKKIAEYDFKRTGRFFSLGVVVLGPCLCNWYAFLFRKFGVATGTKLIKKVAVDQLFYAPSFLAVALGSLFVLEGKSIEEMKSQYKRDYVDILTTGWMIWPAVQLVNFRFVPVNYQVLAVQSVALFWNTYLAWKLNLKLDSPSQVQKSTSIIDSQSEAWKLGQFPAHNAIPILTSEVDNNKSVIVPA